MRKGHGTTFLPLTHISITQMLVKRAYMTVKRAQRYLLLHFFESQGHSIKKQQKQFFAINFLPFGVFKLYEYMNFVSKPYGKYFSVKRVFCSSWTIYQRVPLPSGWAKTFLFFFSSLKALWHVRGAFLKWQLRWPPRSNITSEYICAALILAATSSGILLIPLVEKSYFLVISLRRIANYM